MRYIALLIALVGLSLPAQAQRSGTRWLVDAQGKIKLITSRNTFQVLRQELDNTVKIEADAQDADIPSGVGLVVADEVAGRLMISNDTDGYAISDGAHLIQDANGLTITQRENKDMIFATNNVNRVYIEANGDVAIGDSTTGGSRVKILDSGTTDVRIESSDSAANAQISFFDADGQIAEIFGSGSSNNLVLAARASHGVEIRANNTARLTLSTNGFMRQITPSSSEIPPASDYGAFIGGDCSSSICPAVHLYGGGGGTPANGFASYKGIIDAANDTGTSQVMDFQVKTQASGSITTRPLFTWRNGGTEVLEVPDERQVGLMNSSGTMTGRIVEARLSLAASGSGDMDLSGGQVSGIVSVYNENNQTDGNRNSRAVFFVSCRSIGDANVQQIGSTANGTTSAQGFTVAFSGNCTTLRITNTGVPVSQSSIAFVSYHGV